MSIPQEQAIIDQVVAWLTEINQANGYHTDAGNRVTSEEFRGQRDGVVPLLTVIDSDYTTTDPRKWRMTLDIEGVFLRSENERVQARMLLSDIGRALFRRSSQWRDIGAGVTAAAPQTKQIDRLPDGSDYQRVVYGMVVEYSDLSDAPAGA